MSDSRPTTTGLVRLQKLLAQSGVASRRKCEELMLAGAGRGRRRGRHPARHQGRPDHRGDPGRRQAAAAGLAARLPGAQQAARRRLDDVRPRGPAAPSPTWSPTGPSGCSTSAGSTPTPTGLILLTNDGDFAQRMAHPSYEVDKTYVAEVDGVVTKAHGRAAAGRRRRSRTGRSTVSRRSWSSRRRRGPARSSSW